MSEWEPAYLEKEIIRSERMLWDGYICKCFLSVAEIQIQQNRMM